MTAAIVYRGGEAPSLEHVELLPVEPGEVRVAVGAAGVCHSDLHLVEDRGAGRQLPAVMGHEAAGTVVELGEGVTHLEVGDHVAVAVFAQCGTCDRCLDGQPTLCARSHRGPSAAGVKPPARVRDAAGPVYQFANVGAWSEEIIVPSGSAIRIADDVPFASAALLGCGAVTGYGAATTCGDVGPGDSVVVIGCGGVGLHAVQAARIAGAERIVAVDVSAGKLDTATAVGATHAIDSTTQDVGEQVRALTGGRGADVVLDFVCSGATLTAAVEASRRGSTIVATGLAAEVFELPRNAIVRDGRTLRGNYMGMSSFAETFGRVIDLYRSGDYRLDELVSHQLPLADAQAAFSLFARGDTARSVLVMG